MYVLKRHNMGLDKKNYAILVNNKVQTKMKPKNTNRFQKFTKKVKGKK